MENKYTIDNLNTDSVSVKMQKYIIEDEVSYSIGSPHRKVYVNSTRGRSEVENELPTDIQNAIFAIWGDSPTIIDAEPYQHR